MLQKYRLHSVLLFMLGFLLAGCAGRYFHDAPHPPSPARLYELSSLPYSEYWTGIIFNGNKIGFSHFSIKASKDFPGHYEIRSETVLHFHFLMVDKKINLESYDLVREDLSLKEFLYHYDMDGSMSELSGSCDHENLRISKSSNNSTSTDTIEVTGSVYPGSVVYLYPAVCGIEIGRIYRYDVFDSESQSIDTVNQEILAYQSSDLFQGSAFKMETEYFGQEMTSWIDASGKPLFEMALGGVLISGLESEAEAKRYLLEASMNKDEDLLDFSLIKTKEPITHPGQATYLEVVISGTGDDFTMPSDTRQVCDRIDTKIHCRISVQSPDETGEGDDGHGGSVNEYLRSTYTVPCSDKRIADRAADITEHAAGDLEKIEAILLWISENIKKEPVDVFTALDVLVGEKAECQGHAYLYAAFARSAGIPTRVVGGIVYVEEFKGFLYHSWAESLIRGRWIAIDPTISQVPADATHIKFIEGESISSLIPLVGMIGKLGVEIVNLE
ncbi:MAG: transglutaminase domain-containing protein [Deltaproteobacteria bacterium]|nr:transglutaminase domain-containing protein [Deltaproteobacteria bacterium]